MIRYKSGFTLVEIMIVVAILGLLIAIGVPGFMMSRKRARIISESANLKAITDNIASYCVNELEVLDDIIRLWPSDSLTSDPESYIRHQLLCPVMKTSYSTNNSRSVGSCDMHGTEYDLYSNF